MGCLHYYVIITHFTQTSVNSHYYPFQSPELESGSIIIQAHMAVEPQWLYSHLSQNNHLHQIIDMISSRASNLQSHLQVGPGCLWLCLTADSNFLSDELLSKLLQLCITWTGTASWAATAIKPLAWLYQWTKIFTRHTGKNIIIMFVLQLYIVVLLVYCYLLLLAEAAKSTLSRALSFMMWHSAVFYKRL